MTSDDYLACGGVLLVAIGAAVIYWPAALILLGVLAVAIGVLRSR